MDKRTQTTIRLIVPNLRARWPEQLRPFPDEAVARLYDDFSQSDEHGDNDARFPQWFAMLPDVVITYSLPSDLGKGKDK